MHYYSEGFAMHLLHQLWDFYFVYANTIIYVLLILYLLFHALTLKRKDKSIFSIIHKISGIALLLSPIGELYLLFSPHHYNKLLKFELYFMGLVMFFVGASSVKLLHHLPKINSRFHRLFALAISTALSASFITVPIQNYCNNDGFNGLTVSDKYLFLPLSIIVMVYATVLSILDIIGGLFTLRYGLNHAANPIKRRYSTDLKKRRSSASNYSDMSRTFVRSPKRIFVASRRKDDEEHSSSIRKHPFVIITVSVSSIIATIVIFMFCLTLYYNKWKVSKSEEACITRLLYFMATYNFYMPFIATLYFKGKIDIVKASSIGILAFICCVSFLISYKPFICTYLNSNDQQSCNQITLYF
eukprot:382156_1